MGTDPITKKDAKQAAAAGDIAVLREAAASRDRRVHKIAFNALVKIGTQDAADTIAEFALTEYDPIGQSAATAALRKLDDPRVGLAQRRALWLRGDIHQEPETTVPAVLSAQSDSSQGGIEVLPSPPPDAASAKKRLTVSRSGGIRVGGHADLLLSLPRWPDSKASVLTVTIWYHATRLFQHDQDDRVRTTATGTATQHRSLAMGQKSMNTTSEVAEIPLTSVDADGRLAARFSIPADAPPTAAGVVEWQAQVDLKRRHGTDRNYLAGLRVDPVSPAGATTPAIDPDDWLLRVTKQTQSRRQYEDLVAPKGIERRMRIELATPVVAPGQLVEGQLLFDDDSQLATDLREGGQVPVKLSLECWRGSEHDRTCHRMIEFVGAPEAVTFPQVPGGLAFRMTFPETTAELSACGCSQCPKIGVGQYFRSIPIPPSFRGTDLKRGFDDIRWRVVAAGFDAESPADNWWTAAEVLVAPLPSPEG